jgi:hypothetical protein
MRIAAFLVIWLVSLSFPSALSPKPWQQLFGSSFKAISKVLFQLLSLGGLFFNLSHFLF